MSSTNINKDSNNKMYVDKRRHPKYMQLYTTTIAIKLSGYYRKVKVTSIQEFQRQINFQKILKEYIRRLRKVLKSKLNGGNLVCGVITWAVSLLRYLAAIVSWRKRERPAMGRKTKKLFTIYGALNPKSHVDRLFTPRNEGRKV